MADILIHSAVPSLFTHTESASNIFTDTSTENSHINNNNNNNNKYNNHIPRLHNVFTEHSLISNNLNSNKQPSNSSLIVNDYTTRFNRTKAMFRTLETKSINNNLPLFTTKPIIHNQQERTRDVSIHFIGKSSNSTTNSNDEVPYAAINRKYSNSDQHNDFPADAIEQYKKQQQRDENDRINLLSKSSNKQMKTRTIPFLVPSSALKRMDHLNTIIVRPTKIERSLPKLIFPDDEIQEELKSIENTIVNESDNVQDNDRTSSPLFYERPGIPELDDDNQNPTNDTRRVRFSNAPIRVYPTYSVDEYDRRNEDIDPFSATAEYELEKRIEKMNVFTVEIEKSPEGLGISVLGMGVGADNGLEKLGIFVKSLNLQGVVAKDGRIQVGDQIIEVNNYSLVGVTHAYAKNILKSASGLIKFVIGRDKDIENSEIPGLIQRSLQIDQEREEMSRTLQKYHEEYYGQNLIDDDAIEDHEQTKRKISSEFEIEILKQCYESLEETLENTEKEKEHYQQLYQQIENDFKQIKEKYVNAKVLIKELEDRETELRQQQTILNEQQEKRINELMKKVEELENTIANLIAKSENNSSPKVNENIVSESLDIPERVINRTQTSSSQQLIPTDRHTIATSSIRFPSISLDKIPTYIKQTQESCQIVSNNNKSIDQIATETNQNSLMNKTHIIKTYSKNLPSKHLSTPSLGEVLIDCNIINTNTHVSIVPSLEQTINDSFSNDEYVKVKNWTSDQCIQWLTAQAMTSLIPIFLNRSIDGEKLLLLDSTKMKAMGMKSSKDRDQLKAKIKELKHAEFNRLRERLSQASSFYRATHGGSRLRSSSLTKLKERKFFFGSSSEK
ncbi:unnamed protein product [Rotaria sordida]|uniref:Neurabin-1 n=1 Tax=Rotaria sordida TaxID=392033 RepID=A0A814ZXT3_9BILA|nr:unnamed protein product [Rotaria sordida]